MVFMTHGVEQCGFNCCLTCMITVASLAFNRNSLGLETVLKMQKHRESGELLYGYQMMIVFRSAGTTVAIHWHCN